MFPTFRLSMTWLHTWFGLVLGYVLIVVFFFGALSVFDREIDRWAIPETRFAPQPMPSFDQMLAPIFKRIVAEEHELDEARARVGGPLPDTLPLMNWSAYTTHRDPVLMMFAEFAVTNNPDDPDDHVHGHVTIDPRSGKLLSDDKLKIGSEFFYPMHYGLNLEWKDVGYWIVGLAALAMLAALVSGIVMHRRIFREFFTFRPRKHVQRSTLDLHNLTGVVALPFHFFFALTGLTIFASMYLPVSETMLAPQAQAAAMAEAEAKGLAFKPSGVSAPMASVDAMVVEAQRRWAARGMPGEVGFLQVTHVGDRDSYVSLYRAGSDRVTLVGQAIHFEATTGRVIHEEPPPSVVASVNDFLTGLHLQHFEHWLLRWFYVLGGLAGAVCIVTGFIFFVEKRKRQHAKAGTGGARWADAVAVARQQHRVTLRIFEIAFGQEGAGQIERRIDGRPAQPRDTDTVLHQRLEGVDPRQQLDRVVILLQIDQRVPRGHVQPGEEGQHVFGLGHGVGIERRIGQQSGRHLGREIAARDALGQRQAGQHDVARLFWFLLSKISLG